MDVENAVKHLNIALRLQYRSALSYTLVAGSLTGFPYQPLSLELGRFALAELEDARHLVEKIATLEGEPTSEVAGISFTPSPPDAIQALIDEETETIEALQAVIPFTGNEGRSEALEHRLEHVIMRKQEQVDALIRARRGRS